MVMAMALTVFALNAKTRIHTVAQGETLASIAAAYNVTPEKIIEANPSAAQFIYVGMDLVIPERVTPPKRVESPSQSKVKNDTVPNGNSVISPDGSTVDYIPSRLADSVAATTPSPGGSDEGSTSVSPWGAQMHIGVAFIKDGSALRMGLGATYDIVPQLYVGAMLEYIGNNINKYMGYGDGGGTYDQSTHGLGLPVTCGYRFVTANHLFGVVPYVGIEPGVSLTGSYEYNGDERDIDGGEFACCGILGAKILISGFSLGASYYIPFTDNGGGKKGQFEVSIGYILKD